ncbi:hypothetical protein L1887_13780 [Cichorium endivia]|nr:hypothetical protein L1887_13780 [Cichorium endivia]
MPFFLLFGNFFCRSPKRNRWSSLDPKTGLLHSESQFDSLSQIGDENPFKTRSNSVIVAGFSIDYTNQQNPFVSDPDSITDLVSTSYAFHSFMTFILIFCPGSSNSITVIR